MWSLPSPAGVLLPPTSANRTTSIYILRVSLLDQPLPPLVGLTRPPLTQHILVVPCFPSPAFLNNWFDITLSPPQFFSQPPTFFSYLSHSKRLICPYPSRFLLLGSGEHKRSLFFRGMSEITVFSYHGYFLYLSFILSRFIKIRYPYITLYKAPRPTSPTYVLLSLYSFNF